MTEGYAMFCDAWLEEEAVFSDDLLNMEADFFD